MEMSDTQLLMMLLCNSILCFLAPRLLTTQWLKVFSEKNKSSVTLTQET